MEGERQQGVSGQDRCPFIEGLPHGRPAAAHLVVVHGRQVVMRERIAVDAFDRRRGVDRALGCEPEKGRRFDDEKRPQPLAAAERGMADGARKPLWTPARSFAGHEIFAEKGLKPRVDQPCGEPEPLREGHERLT